MRKLIFALLLFVSVAAFAQNDAGMEKYLAEGAVPVVDGKVLFKGEVKFAQELPAERVGAIAKQWVDDYLTEATLPNNKLLNVTGSSVEFAGSKDIVFSSNAFSYDKARMMYVMKINFAPDGCTMELGNIRYSYNDGVSNMAIYAEDYITDANAVNKKRTRLLPVTGKFRRKTLDEVGEIFNSFSQAFRYVAQPVLAETVKEAPQIMDAGAVNGTVVAAAVVAESGNAVTGNVGEVEVQKPHNVMEGFRKVDPRSIPGNIIGMVGDDWMLITAGNNEKFNMMTASWGGLGVLYGKPVAICFINPARYTYGIMEDHDTYTLAFFPAAYKEALRYCGTKSGRDEDKVKGSGLTPVELETGAMSFKEACIIIECSKLLSQQLSANAIDNGQIKERWSSQPMHKMYIGEIVNVWVK